MKTLKIFSILPVLIAFTTVSFAQKNKTESIPVSGNCGMCETKIEKAAKEAGATSAQWVADKKILTVTYNTTSTNAAKIQEAVAKAGYDTRDVRATDEAYNKLHGCCQYEREAVKETVKKECCDKCEMKDGKCADMKACDDKTCCKDATGKAMSCCTKDGDSGKAECCKNGKCEKHS